MRQHFDQPHHNLAISRTINLRAAALADPTGFVDGLSERTIIDEVQRVPELFLAIKVAVDRRVPGRFLLTGSANVLFVPTLADSLAGRMQALRLHPLAQCELESHVPHFIDALFTNGFHLKRTDRLGDELARRIAEGGFPAAITRPDGRRRATWYCSKHLCSKNCDDRQVGAMSNSLFLMFATRLAWKWTSSLNVARSRSQA